MQQIYQAKVGKMGKDIKDLDALLDDDDVSSTCSEKNTPVVEDSLKNQFNKVFYKNQSKETNEEREKDQIGENLDKFEKLALNTDDENNEEFMMGGLTDLLNKLNTSLIEKESLYPQIIERLKECDNEEEKVILQQIKTIYEESDYSDNNSKYQGEINKLLDRLEDVTGDDDILFKNSENGADDKLFDMFKDSKMNEESLKKMMEGSDGCAQQ